MVMRLSDTCTSGWLHWGHGELWLTQDHVLRVPRTLLTVKAAGRGLRSGGALGAIAGEVRRGQSQVVVTEMIDDHEWRDSLVRAPASVAIDLETVARHRLRRGAMTSRLDVDTGSGAHHVFLWMRNDKVMAPLARAMGNLTAHRQAFEE